MSSDVFEHRGLFWKEMRELFPVGILLLLLPMAGFAVVWLINTLAGGWMLGDLTSSGSTSRISGAMLLGTAGGVVLALAIGGALAFKGKELGVGGSPADALPISRWRILSTKMVVVFLLSAVVLLMFPLPWYLSMPRDQFDELFRLNTEDEIMLIKGLYTQKAWLMSVCLYGFLLVLALLAMVQRCLFSSGIMSVFVTILTGLAMFYMVTLGALQLFVDYSQTIHPELMVADAVHYIWNLALIAPLLLVTLFFAYGSRVLRETGYLGRFLMGLLFSWCLIVYVFTIAFASWADLRLLIFGA